MISLKQYLDLDPTELKKYREPDPSELLAAAAVKAFHAVVSAMGNCGRQVSTALDFGLHENLQRISESVTETATPAMVQQAQARVESRLRRWSDDAAGYLKQKADDVREILVVLVRTVESASKRNQNRDAQFAKLTARLESVANLEDIGQIRALLAESVTDLRSCAEEVNEQEQTSIAELQSEVAAYQIKLEQAEAQASRDPLTGLLNRRAIETQLERLIERKRPFCLVMIDLNGFKQVNDQHGHLAGDSLLVQFAGELHAQSRSGDVVGRWGGDEFIAILQGDANGARGYIERVEKWAFGTYTVALGTGEKCKVSMQAAIGLAEWHPGMSIQTSLARADADMYKRKQQSVQ